MQRTKKDADWKTVDAALRDIAARRALLDGEELEWLLRADAMAIHRHYGYSSLEAYLAGVMGYTTRTTRERLNIARTLVELPNLQRAFISGQIKLAGIRELIRVATPTTDREWANAARGKQVREIQQMIRGHDRGAYPGTVKAWTVRRGRRRTVVLPREDNFYVPGPGAMASLWRVQEQMAVRCGHGITLDEVVVKLAMGYMQQISIETSASKESRRPSAGRSSKEQS